MVRSEVAEISYEINGIAYEGLIEAFTRSWTDGNQYYRSHMNLEMPPLKAGDTVKLFYQPSDPETVLMENDVLVQFLKFSRNDWKLIEQLETIGIFAFLCIAVGIHFWRRKKYGDKKFITWFKFKLDAFKEDHLGIK